MKKILITGGAGYIGSVLTPYLHNLGYHITVIDNFLYKQTSLAAMARKDNFKLIFGDVRDERLIKEQLKEVDVIIVFIQLLRDKKCLIQGNLYLRQSLGKGTL